MVELKDGYKDTEIGVIPIEWEAVELGDIATFSKGKGISKKDISEDGVECIRYGELFTTYNEIITTIKSKTNSTTNMMYSKINDTLMPTSDVTPNGLATASALNKEGVILGGDILIIRSSDILNSYLSYFIRSHKKQIMKLVSGSTVYHIYANDMKNFKIPLPPLKEQEKIADILSTADEKIDAIATQIEKTKTLKKGLLQKLLSEGIGHSEFKDSELGKIPESWGVVKLDNLTTKIGDGLHGTPKYVEQSDYYFINGNNLNGKSIEITENTKCVSEEEYNKNKKILDDTTVLLSINGTIGSLAYYSNEAVMLGKSVAYMNSNNRISKQFLFYLLKSSHILNYFMLELTGTTIKNLSLKTIRNTKIPLPPLEEQKQIADILSTADEKLAVLRAKKEKYKTLKKGLLQKLLSGEVRV